MKNKDIASTLSDINGNLTLAGIIHAQADTAARGKERDLLLAYAELLFSIADTHLLNAIALYCENHNEAPPPETVQIMATRIYKDLLRPPAWNWAARLRHNLDTTHTPRSTSRIICAAIGVDSYLDRRTISCTLDGESADHFCSGADMAANSESSRKNARKDSKRQL